MNKARYQILLSKGGACTLMRLVKPKRVPQGDAEQFLPWQGGVMSLRHENVIHNAHLAEGGTLMVR